MINKILVVSFVIFLSSSTAARIDASSDDENQVTTSFILNTSSHFSTPSRVITSDVYIDALSQDTSYNEDRLPGPTARASSSPLCHLDVTSSEEKVTAAGCVMESLIPKDKTYRVEFQDQHKSVEDPSVCWKTCSLIFPNTTLALVAKTNHSTASNEGVEQQEGKLVCLCALGDAIDVKSTGPDVFCNSVCNNGNGTLENNLACGGQHTFQDNGVREIFFSIFCIHGGPAPPPPPPPPPPNVTTTTTTTTTTGSSTTTTPGDTDAGSSLHNILKSLVDGNVMSIVIIGLIICLIILVLVLITWIYMFVESLDPTASSAFYRGFSSKRPNTLNPGANQSANILSHHEGYGTTNRAFDPSPEVDPVGPIRQSPLSDTVKDDVKVETPNCSGKMLAKRMSSEEYDEDDDDTNDETENDAPSNDDFVKREGFSTFYDPDSVSQADTEVASDHPIGQKQQP